jgi:hypothetical protein
MLNVTIEEEVITVILSSSEIVQSTTVAAHNILSSTHSDTEIQTLVEGDLLVVNSDGNLERLPVGNEGEVVKVIEGVPAYGSGASGGAPVEASYVVMGDHVDLTNTRRLTGTANQITVNDNGAGSTVVLSTPQNIATGSSPTFAGMTLTSNLAKIANVPYVWPSSQGSAATFLSNDGAGNLSWATSGGAPTTVSYVVLAASPTLTNERVITAGNGIQLSDGGAGNALTLATRQQNSITQASGILQLVNDSASPGNSMAYMTNASGVKGWYSSAAGSGLRAATKIVAANNSTDKNKADYVCDGTDDQIEINQALSAISSLGGCVLLLEGTYNITGHITIYSNGWLRGSGYGTVVRYSTNMGSDYAVSIKNYDHTIGNTNIRVSDLTIDGNGSGQTYHHFGIYLKNVTRAFVDHVYVHDQTCWGIRFDFSSGVHVSDVFVNSYNISTGDCLHFVGCYDCTVNNAVLHSNNDDTFCLTSQDSVYCHDISCSNMVLSGPGAARPILIGGESPDTASAYNISLSNITISSGGYIAILGLSSYPCYNITFNGLVHNSTSAFTGMHVTYVNKSVFSSMKIYSPSVAGAGLILDHCDKIQVNGSQINSSGNYSIYTDTLTNSNIQNCILTENAAASSLTMLASSYNTITGNKIIRSGATTYGIEIVSGTKNMVHGNNLYQSGNSGDISDGGTGTMKAYNVNNAGTGWV